MGRKSLQKARKGPNSKTENWAKTLLPLLQTLKLDSLSMNTLSKLMGVSKSTIYEYFSTKEEVMDYVVAHKIAELNQLKEGLGLRLLSEWDNPSLMVDFLTVLPQGISAHFLQELKMHFPSSWQQVWKFLEELLSELRVYYEWGISSGKFSPVSVDLLIELDRYFISQLITDVEFHAQAGISLEQIVADFIQLRFEGLLGGK